MGPKRVKCCRFEQMGTKDFGKMMKRVQILEEGRVPAKETKIGGKKRITRKEYQRLLNQKKLAELGKGKNHEGRRGVA